MQYSFLKNIKLFLLLSSIVVIGLYNNISYAETFKENHTKFCNLYVNSTITLGGRKTKLTSKICDLLFLEFAPGFEKKFIPLISGLTEDFSKYKTKNFQIEDFVNKSIDSGQIFCGDAKRYEKKDNFLNDLDYKIDCKIDKKLKFPFDFKIQLFFNSNRFFSAIKTMILVEPKIFDSQFDVLLKEDPNTAFFFVDLIKYSLLILKSNNTMPEVLLSNNLFVIGATKRLDIKDIKKVIKNNGWIGYVINYMDYSLNKGNERRKKMIFPENSIYSNKDECYRKFKILFSKEPLLSMYPPTNNTQTSYIYGCVEK